MVDYGELVESLPLEELCASFPVVTEFLKNYRLESLCGDQCLPTALEDISSEILEDFGMDADDICDALCGFLEALYRPNTLSEIRQITILGGHDKSGNNEKAEFKVSSGEIVSIVGPTGAGKSRLLADIEYAARGDTPTGRRVLFDGRELDDEQRFSLGNCLVAQISQNMNFVIDVSVENFLLLHERSRGIPESEQTMERCLTLANALSGEPFDRSVKVTQLSGGQSRALMIADAACMSSSPILLIDEIENAGIDRIKAIEELAKGDKIVLLSTHDPLLALTAKRRIVLQNGGILSVLETSESERKCLSGLIETDRHLMDLRRRLREGKRIDSLF